MLAELQARADHELLSIKDPDDETRKLQAKRKTEIIKWRKAERDDD